MFYGDNAQGKTNLLEAIAYLSCAKSHRARYDRELIYHGVDHAFIQGEVWDGRRLVTLEAKLQRQGRRQLMANGVRLKTAAELSDSLKTVLFCPEDLFLVKAGAAERRRFFDECISQLRPRYAVALAEYKKLYEHKTRILRDWEEKPIYWTPWMISLFVWHKWGRSSFTIAPTLSSSWPSTPPPSTASALAVGRFWSWTIRPYRPLRTPWRAAKRFLRGCLPISRPTAKRSWTPVNASPGHTG